MKKTKIISFIIFLMIFSSTYADEQNNQKENNHQLFVNFRSGINATVKNGVSDGSIFSNHLSLELSGKVNDKVSYHFSNRLNNFKGKPNNLNLDLAYLKYKWNKKIYLLFGKQPFSFGGMEYSNNSIYDRPYNSIDKIVYKNNDNPIGLNLIYLPIKNHEFQLQIVNGIKNPHNPRTEDPNQRIDSPAGYSLNWNWNLFKDKMIQNRWSYSFFQENEREKYWKYLALGSKFNLSPFSIETDYILSDEDVDRNGKMINILRSNNAEYSDTAPIIYETYLVKLKYNFLPKWNIVAKGTYEIGSSKKDINGILKENQIFKRESNYYGGIEFVPIKNDNVSFHLLCKNQVVDYDLGKIKIEKDNKYSVILGLIYRIKII